MARPAIALGLFLVLGAASADADLIALRAHVPFSFKVGEKVLPPGDYAFRLDGAEFAGVLRVRGESAREEVLILTRKAEIPDSSREKPKLVFEKDGEEYVLSQVLDPGRYGIQVLNPRRRPDAERVVVLTD
jgi:hypothetical protein